LLRPRPLRISCTVGVDEEHARAAPKSAGGLDNACCPIELPWGVDPLHLLDVDHATCGVEAHLFRQAAEQREEQPVVGASLRVEQKPKVGRGAHALLSTVSR
jgi:hypothetical protein